MTRSKTALLLAAILTLAIIPSPVEAVSLTWTGFLVSAGTNQVVARFASIDGNSYLAAYSEGGEMKIARTDNSGETWAESTVEAADDYQPIALAVIDEDTWGIIANDFTTDVLRWYRTTDAGGAWSNAAIDSTGNAADFKAFHCILSETSFMVLYERDDSGEFLPYYATSSDGGATWTTTAIGGLTYFDGANTGDMKGRTHCPSATTWMRVVDSTFGGTDTLFVIRTSDAGANWVQLDVGLANYAGSTFRAGGMVGYDTSNWFVTIAYTSPVDPEERLVFSSTSNAGASWPVDATIDTDSTAGDVFGQVVTKAGSATRVLLAYSETDSGVTTPRFGQSDNSGGAWETAAITSPGVTIRDFDIISETGPLYGVLVSEVADGDLFFYRTGEGADSPTESAFPTGPLPSVALGEGADNVAFGFGFQTPASQFLFGLIPVSIGVVVGASIGKTISPKGAYYLSTILGLGAGVFNYVAGLWPAWSVLVLLGLAIIGLRWKG